MGLTTKMSKKLHDIGAKVPFLGEVHCMFGQSIKGLLGFDYAIEGCNVELFVRSAHIIWTMDVKGVTMLSFLTGWLLDTPLNYLHA